MRRHLIQRGASGTLAVTSERVTLAGRERKRSSELTPLLRTWHQLSPLERAAQMDRLVLDLAPTARGIPPPSSLGWLALAMIAALTIGLGSALIVGITGAQQRRADSSQSQPPTPDLPPRSQQVCEATLSRIMRGGTVGPTDAEGWLAELQLLRNPSAPPLEGTPAAARFFEFDRGEVSRVSWEKWPPSLRELRGSLQLHERVDVSARKSSLTLHGDLLRSFFTEQQRNAWLQLASEFARAVGASHGAFFARCEHLPSHQMGVWFAAPDLPGAGATLLYFMGAHAQTDMLAPGLVVDDRNQPLPVMTAIRQLREPTEKLSELQLRTWLAADGGMLTGASQPLVLTFPFRDANRAARSGRRLARQLGVLLEQIPQAATQRAPGN